MTTIVGVAENTKGAYTAFGGCKEFMAADDHQIFLFGGTGTGKTWAGCTKMLLRSIMYPGVKTLFTRHSYRALVQTGVETWEAVCRLHGWEFGKGPNKILKLGEREPNAYEFPYAKRMGIKNGKPHLFEGQSKIVLSSISKVKDQLGAEYDYIYLNQPERSTYEDWMFLVGRANGRRGHAPYPQLYGDPNPEHERHWIKLGGYTIDKDGTLTTARNVIYRPDEYIRDGSKFLNLKGDEIDDVKWRMIKSTYKDNPVMWNHKLDCLTKEGEEQLGHLVRTYDLTMKERMIEGQWCSFEGRVFEDAWDRTKHLRPRKEFEITDAWERYWAIDFGYDDPACVLWFAKHPSRELYVCYRYIYETNLNINELIDKIQSFTIGEPRPKLVISDRDPDAVSILTQGLGLNVISARKGPNSIKTGLSVLIDMLKNDELVFLEDSCVSADERLLNKKHPIGFEEEAENYRWHPDKPDVPIGGQDHAIDPTRYLFTYIKAQNRIVPFIWK